MSASRAAGSPPPVACQHARTLARFRTLHTALEGGVSAARVAREHGVPLRTLRRWLAAYRRDGLVGLARRPRSDRGTARHLRPEVLRLIEGVALASPRPTAASVHRLAVAMAAEHGWPPPCYGTIYALLRRLGREEGSAMAEQLLTTVVGSYPQPDWLIDRARLGSRLPPRVRARELWRVAEPQLEAAQDDATLLAIRAMERAGVDIISDGEMRRESYSNRFATALAGMDLDNPGTALDRTGHPNPVPRVVGPIRRLRPVETRDVAFLRANTDRRIKITVPGPFTITQQAQNDHYPDERSLALDVAAAVNAEIKDLFAAGADVVQIDEPYLQARPERAREYGIAAINRALEGVAGTTALHMCFGYAAIVHERGNRYAFLRELRDCTVRQISIEAAQPRLDLAPLADLPDKTIILGVLDLGDMRIETPETVADRIRAALDVVPAERLILAPDCGMKYLPHEVASGKLQALVDGTAIVRAELQ